jgi:hypothetical protein
MAQLDQAAKDIEFELKDVDQSTDRLRATFEQYFQGVERQPPTTERDTLKRRVRNLHVTKLRNTELRFRINQLVAKFNSYDLYWTRTLKQIEEGTYHRDVVRARYRAQLQAKQEATQAEQDPGAEQSARTANRPASAPRTGDGISNDHVDAIYNAYMVAKRRCKENTKGLTRDALATSLRKQIPAIQKQYKCKTVEFKVVIKGGKAVLKAVPKF